MDVRLAILCTMVACLACAVLSTPAPAGEPAGLPEAVEVPRVLPDGCVDTSSIEGILKGVLKEGMSDQEKAIALYQWFRRLVFHHRNMGTDRRDVLRVVNSYGYNLCGSQTACMLVLLKAAGLKARMVAGDAGEGYGGHTFYEVFYGDKWHCFDTMTSFAVLNREKPPMVAGLEEMKADPTLVSKAVEEKRTVPGFLPCQHEPEITYDNREELAKLGWKADFRWATFTFGKGKAADVLGFWLKAPEKPTFGGEDYGGANRPGLLDIRLKPGERWVSLWDNLGKWVESSSYPALGPFHTCGRADSADDVNFRYYEPYAKKDVGPVKTCYRYYGNGFLEWKPADAAALLTGSSARDLTAAADGAALSGSGELAIPVRAPGPVVGIELDLDLKQKGAAAKTVVLLVLGKDSKEVWSKAGDAAGVEKVVIPYQPSGSPWCEYSLAIRTAAGADGSAQFAVKRLKTVYQLNIYALPGLQPGKNTVRVSAKTAKLAGSKLVVEYQWSDGEGWKDEHRYAKEFQSFPASFDVEVTGAKMPRMKSLELRVEPAGK
ncbi:MAG TPA: transglutaminase domain-containing protein [Planctomycetota bacterium]|nr:transglutaminase domain-containing protein [Planctomycetota bacterium]